MYGVIVSIICDIQSIADFVAAMRGKITKKIGTPGSKNLAVGRITRWPYFKKGFLYKILSAISPGQKEVAVITGWPY